MEEQELNTPEVTQPEVGTNVEETNEPSSMLEAIESGLSGDNESGQPRDDAGRYAPKKEESKPEEVKPEIKQEAKPEDEHAMPEGLSAKAQERFTSLVNKVKEKEQQFVQASEQLGQFRDLIQSTGASPQEFSQAIDYMRMVNKGDFEGALRLIDDQRRQISLALGKPLPGADPLAEFPDLRQRVDSYHMDEQSAIEVARSRLMQQQSQQNQRQQNEQQQSQQMQQQTRQQAISQIDEMGKQWAKTDPDFTMKEDIILKQLPEIARNFPPNMWPQQVSILYNTISAMPMSQPARHNPAPLRPTGQTAGNRQPGSMLEAMEMGLGYSGG